MKKNTPSPQPLTPKRRAEIDADIERRIVLLAAERASTSAPVFDPVLDAFVDLMRAERFWRERELVAEPFLNCCDAHGQGRPGTEPCGNASDPS